MIVGMKLKELKEAFSNFGSERLSYSGEYEVSNDCILIGHYMFSHGTGASRSNIIRAKKGDKICIRDNYTCGSHWLTFFKVEA